MTSRVLLAESVVHADSVVVTSLHAALLSDPSVRARAVEGAIVRQVDAGAMTRAVAHLVTEINCKNISHLVKLFRVSVS